MPWHVAVACLCMAVVAAAAETVVEFTFRSRALVVLSKVDLTQFFDSDGCEVPWPRGSYRTREIKDDEDFEMYVITIWVRTPHVTPSVDLVRMVRPDNGIFGNVTTTATRRILLPESARRFSGGAPVRALQDEVTVATLDSEMTFDIRFPPIVSPFAPWHDEHVRPNRNEVGRRRLTRRALVASGSVLALGLLARKYGAAAVRRLRATALSAHRRPLPRAAAPRPTTMSPSSAILIGGLIGGSASAWVLTDPRFGFATEPERRGSAGAACSRSPPQTCHLVGTIAVVVTITFAV